jgi:signal recognition particle subunit SEC65
MNKLEKQLRKSDKQLTKDKARRTAKKTFNAYNKKVAEMEEAIEDIDEKMEDIQASPVLYPGEWLAQQANLLIEKQIKVKELEALKEVGKMWFKADEGE